MTRFFDPKAVGRVFASLAKRDAARKRAGKKYNQPVIVKTRAGGHRQTVLGLIEVSTWSDGKVNHDYWTPISINPRFIPESCLGAVENARDDFRKAQARYERTLATAYEHGQAVSIEEGKRITAERGGA